MKIKLKSKLSEWNMKCTISSILNRYIIEAECIFKCEINIKINKKLKVQKIPEIQNWEEIVYGNFALWQVISSGSSFKLSLKYFQRTKTVQGDAAIIPNNKI